jgi:hypothetical protein
MLWLSILAYVCFLTSFVVNCPTGGAFGGQAGAGDSVSRLNKTFYLTSCNSIRCKINPSSDLSDLISDFLKRLLIFSDF